ncbi:putative spermidine/putrescine transport system permease protein [Promicromonospora umidemergens]|uniref:ABC transmembrane type-1 domain-containing protein n=1 Tax=Promicromonospora umidemergens TaxID=629679 RepID=A0ABP8X2E7_9MICO|nr:ABC transporter permease subunit [Promicromonospora umidemergens]MCP2285548.1 putative spermidine/putrescine transport system permease protein [Promicromonospora umidemergens]
MNRRTASSRRAALLVLPALLPTVLVLGAGLGAAVIQSLGLLPLVGKPELSSAAYRALVVDDVLTGLGVSVAIAAASTSLALLVGATAAVLVQRSRIGGLAAVAAAVVPIPHLVGAATVGLLLADSGLVARLVGAQPGTFPALVGGPWWVAVVLELAWKESAFVAVVVLSSLATTERDLDEAAAGLGAGPWQRLRRVTLPLAAPALVVSGTISFAYVVGSYEVAWLLGRTYPEPLAVLAFRLFSDTDLTMRPQALAVAVLTVAVAAGALVAGAALLRRVAVLR